MSPLCKCIYGKEVIIIVITKNVTYYAKRCRNPSRGTCPQCPKWDPTRELPVIPGDSPVIPRGGSR